MDTLFVVIILAVLGMMIGSFAGATVWRLRARQLVEDKKEGEEVDKNEYKKLLPLTKTTISTDRSRCLHCGHTLPWYDLLPLVSWLSTGGKCRYCHQSIGWFEPVIELGTALLFVALFVFWPLGFSGLDAVQFVLWLVAGSMLVILFAYDSKWFLLPNYVMFPLIAIAAVIAGVHVFQSSDMGMAVADLLLAIGILSGIYFVLWLVSKGKWIGFGDVKLGLALGFLLGSWPLAFVALFVANFIGCLIVLPGMLSGKITRRTRVPFGPLLIIGGIVTFLFGQVLLDWYLGLMV